MFLSGVFGLKKTTDRFGFYLVIVIAHLACFSLLFPGQGWSKVTGVCSNCHTMHNSQNGTEVVPGGPMENLLTDNCVGCHSNTSSSDTIVDLNGSQIPIVYNTVPPTNPLAGGNFYWVVNNGDAYGHNVRGISSQDADLSWAPGSVGCLDSCHESLTLTDEETHDNMKNGCRGCHQGVKHHGTDPPSGQPVTAEGGWYRFLSAPDSHDGIGGAPVYGIEDTNWEQSADKDNHNTYYGGNGADNESPESIGKFCAGCHYNFHSPGFATTFRGNDNGGGGNPWLRHPADASLPSTGEYTSYTEYDPVIPVGRPEKDGALVSVDKSLVRPGTDKVICMSCHRAHGSPYPDILRWNYDEMNAGGVDSGGCFKCHSAKDGTP